jgi:hypothetical protein
MFRNHFDYSLRPSLIATMKVPNALEDEALLVAGRDVEGLDLSVNGY